MTSLSLAASAHVVVIGAVLLMSASGCSARRARRSVLAPPNPLADVTIRLGRVLVAGFASTPVRGVDANEETSRVVGGELRNETSVQVVKMEPLVLQPHLLADVAFWRRLGEEYGEPLIVTSVVDFKSIGPHYEERTVGRRTLRLWFPQFSLALRLLLIDGRTGEVIGSAVCGPIVAHAATGRERALTLYYRLIDRTMPSILAICGRRMMLRSPAAPTCRTELVEGRSES